MRLIALSAAQQQRLQRLARSAGRTPKAMLKFVFRDGFEACEEDVRENLSADAEFAAGKSVSHKDAMKRARAVVESHAREHKQAA
jgi:predicted transcriptional regulator